MELKIICPECKKKFEYELKTKQRAIKDLYKLGYGIREIQRIFNYKSPHSVSKILGRLK